MPAPGASGTTVELSESVGCSVASGVEASGWSSRSESVLVVAEIVLAVDTSVEFGDVLSVELDDSVELGIIFGGSVRVGGSVL